MTFALDHRVLNDLVPLTNTLQLSLCVPAVGFWLELSTSEVLCMVDNVTPRRHGLLNKNHSAGHGIPPYELLIRKVPEVPQTTRVLPLSLVLYHK